MLVSDGELSSNSVPPLLKGESMAETGGAQKSRTKKQRSAYNKLNYARRKGRAPRPGGMCRKCGKKKATEAAHSDYNKPTSVRMLCASCNRKEGLSKNAGKRVGSKKFKAREKK